MNINVYPTLSTFLTQLPWFAAGSVLGLCLVPLARFIPGKVLHLADAALHEWEGPGGGLEHPVPPARRIWVPVLNALVWVFVAQTMPLQPFWEVLPLALMTSTLLLLGLIDWDTTLLPDLIVLPLGIAGLACSYAGITGQSLAASALSAALVLVVMGGFAWLYQRIRGKIGIGGGDLKLFAALAAWSGIVDVLYIMLWANLLTIAWYFIWRRFKGLSPEAEWPFGPSIVAAAFVIGLYTTW